MRTTRLFPSRLFIVEQPRLFHAHSFAGDRQHHHSSGGGARSLPRCAGEAAVPVFLIVVLRAQLAALLNRPQVVPHHELGRSVDDEGGARLVSVLTTRQQAVRMFLCVRNVSHKSVWLLFASTMGGWMELILITRSDAFRSGWQSKVSVV